MQNAHFEDDSSITYENDLLLAMAKDNNTPSNILSELSNHKSWEVRLYVSKNTASPSDALERLARDSIEIIKSAALKNQNLSLFNIDRYAASKDWKERSLVARNPSCHLDILLELSKDNSPFVRSSAVRHFKFPKENLKYFTNDMSPHVLEGILAHPNCPKRIINKMAGHHEKVVRAAVAKREDCPKKILDQLCRDHEVAVKSALARNPSCTADHLYQLSLTKNYYVKANVIDNPNVTTALLEGLISDFDGKIQRKVLSHPLMTINNIIGVVFRNSDKFESDFLAEIEHHIVNRAHHEWEESIKNGLSLKSHHTDVKKEIQSADITLGDFLISIGWNNIYQTILSAELQSLIQCDCEFKNHPQAIKIKSRAF